MLLANGLIAHAALPLALAGLGGGLLAQVASVEQGVISTYETGRMHLRAGLGLEGEPEALTLLSSGEVACWQVSDRNIHESEVARDYQGNIYVQDPNTSQLRVLKFEAGFRLEK